MANLINLSPHPAFVFINSFLTSMIGHPCECRSCAQNRESAFGAQVWLYSVATKIPQVKGLADMVEGQAEIAVPMPPPVVETPEEVIRLVEGQLARGFVKGAQLAVISGWLESVKALSGYGEG